MKPSFKFSLVSICSFLAMSFAMNIASADEIPSVREVVVGVSDVFVPGGFDSEADAYVVVSGIFPNGCYRWKTAQVKHTDALNHEIVSKADVSQGMCLMVLVPFTKEVRLGKLVSGTHRLKFLNGDGTYLEKTVNVE